MNRSELTGKIVVVTGAASGIGRAIALTLADLGCGLELMDVDKGGLEELGSLLADRGCSFTAHEVDLSERGLVYAKAREIEQDRGHVDILINCAAVVVVETLEDITFDDFEWVMKVNFWGVVHTTKAFLPILKQRPEAHIVNVTSVDGIVPTPNCGAYAATKAALKSFSETLSQELHDTNISVSCVIPGGVRTNLHRNARFFKIACPGMSHEECVDFFERSSLTSPEKAAARIVDAMCAKRFRVLVGLDARLIDFAARVMPQTATALAGYLNRNLKSDKFRWVELFKRRSEG